jgi:AAA15 family ATPase/GTPase
MNYSERLKIKDFFSVKEFDWQVKPFNIITGGMASGKSLCMKLLYFFERAVEASILSAEVRNKDYFEKENIYERINSKFNKVFNSFDKQKDFKTTELEYVFSCGKSVFDLSAHWENGKLNWHSGYIEGTIEKWYNYFKSEDTGKTRKVDTVERGQQTIFKAINRDFKDMFPITTLFVPAARAVTAITNSTFEKDALFNRFLQFKNSIIDWLNESESKGELERVKKILRIRKIKIPRATIVNDDKISIILEDGRTVSPFDLSSGQQELFYFLFLTNYIPQMGFQYDNGSSSVFIEEPSAHLFPLEQKNTVEFIVEIYRELCSMEERNCKFFVSTHSPYALNTVNNMLKKGALLNRFPGQTKKINAEIAFPHLSSDEVSAYFIKDGAAVNILEEEDHYINDDEIARISFDIMDDSNKLSMLKNILLDEENDGRIMSSKNTA